MGTFPLAGRNNAEFHQILATFAPADLARKWLHLRPATWLTFGSQLATSFLPGASEESPNNAEFRQILATFAPADLARIWFTIGDICARLTEKYPKLFTSELKKLCRHWNRVKCSQCKPIDLPLTNQREWPPRNFLACDQ
ncbi:hypothetical protein AVEN_257305-1 [Araneus ventricosus]|uniref:Uncharacterized protein n=1 Tax=Araneus ventricosus TaxID=182803 RepID=A0A4Y2SDY1_ARAVE|nr:hypothetical protein AVEN_257305-1 [Araneus ventricosus]